MSKLKKRKLNIETVETLKEPDPFPVDEQSSVKETLGIEDGVEVEEKSEEIDLNDTSKGENKATVDYTDQKFIDDLINKDTKKVDEPKPENAFKGKSHEDIKNEMNNAENGETMSAEDLYSVADIIITIIDSFAASAMKAYAKDTKEDAYSLSEKKKKHLIKILAAILVKYQAKLKTEILFIFALILFYATPFIAARSRRKKIVALEKEIEAKKEAGETFVPTDTMRYQYEKEEIVEEAVEMHKESEDEIMKNLPQILKKSKGRATRK